MRKRLIGIILSVVLCLSLFPVMVNAASYPSISYNITQVIQGPSGCYTASIAMCGLWNGTLSGSATDAYNTVYALNGNTVDCSSGVSLKRIGYTQINSGLTLQNLYNYLQKGPVIIGEKKGSKHFAVVYAYTGNPSSLTESGFQIMDTKVKAYRLSDNAKLTENGRTTLDKWIYGSSYYSFSYYSKGGAINSPPTYARISLPQYSYKSGQTVNFSLSTDGVTDTVWVYFPDGSSKYYENNKNSFSTSFSQVGEYQALVQTWNSVGEKTSERIRFHIGPPTFATIKTNKSAYSVGETVNFTLSSDGDPNNNTVWIYYPDGTSKYYEKNGSSFSTSFNKAGTYQALVQTWNGVGSKTSNKISFTVGQQTPPTYAKISLPQYSYAVGQTVTFSLSSDGNTNTVWVYFPDGSSKYYENNKNSFSTSFSQVGEYKALVQTWNGVGEKTSEKISFHIGPPTYATIKINKSTFAVGETVYFTLSSDGNPNLNTVWIYYPDGTKKYYEKNGSTFSTSFSKAGTYQALVQTWNSVSSASSDRITFTIVDKEHVHSLTHMPSKASTCTTAGDKEYWYCSGCGKYYSDSAGKKEVTKDSLTVVELAHNYKNGSCTRCGANDPNYQGQDDPAPVGPIDEWPGVHFPKNNVYFQDQFVDVPANQWFTFNVAEAFEFSLMKGVSATKFNPYGDVTIAEAITMASRIHSIYTTGSENFVQESGNKWYQVYLDYALRNGIINQAYYNCDVNHRATRAQYAEIFANAMPGDGLHQINNIGDGKVPDVPMNKPYASKVYKLYRAGILTGGDAMGTFSPDTYITRAESAAIVSRMAESDNRRHFTLN